MAISVSCPGCAKTYQVKDEAAGKKFRCKACEAIVSVPEGTAAAQGDPWDNLDLGTQQDPYGEENESPFEAPVRRRKKKSSRKKSRGGGMPISVMVAIGCEAMLILINVVGVGGNLMDQNVGGACGSIFRILIEVAAIIGYVQAQNSTRWTAVILSALGIVFALACGAGLLIAGPNLPPQVQQQIPQDLIMIVILVLVVQIIIWAVLLGTLVTPSARDYFEQR
jgi:hypothetical protein